jgi:hypothetical protein
MFCIGGVKEAAIVHVHCATIVDRHKLLLEVEGAALKKE